MTAGLSAYLIAGRVVSAPPDTYVNETAARTVAQGITDGVDAEKLGRAIHFAQRHPGSR